MTAIAEATRCHVNASGSPTTLHLFGDVGPVLESRCELAPRTSGAAGLIRAIDLSRAGAFGLGAAAFGAPKEHAVQQLGEYVLINGNSWWMPAAKLTSARSEPSGAQALTPFLFQWDHMKSAVATLRSASPLPLEQWYGYLLERCAELGIGGTGTIVVEITADIQAGMISDKHLALAPLTEHRPPDHQPIVDEAHLDTFFVRNAAVLAHGADTWCTVVMAGVAIDPARATAAWGPEFIQRGFYATPGVTSESQVIHHTHAVLTARRGQHHPTTAAAQVIHIESDTLLRRADVRIGVVSAVALD